jgi:hypothetical protein
MNVPSMIQSFATTAGANPFNFDPLNGAAPTTQPIVWYPGVLPGVIPANGANPALPPLTYSWKLPPLTAGATSPGATKYIWVCLRRPANPFAPVSAVNPMVVVDSMRVPYADGSVALGTTNPAPPPAGPTTVPQVLAGQPSATGNAIFSAQRFQPYRGGHAVPNPYGAMPTLDARYGFTEQVVAPAPSTAVAGGGYTPTYSTNQQTQGVYYIDTANNNKLYYGTNVIYHSLGFANEQMESWDFYPFHDRDFSSVAELSLVPGCPPGLFTKQFAEFAPSNWSTTTIFSTVTPQANPVCFPAGGGVAAMPVLPLAYQTASAAFSINNPLAPTPNPGVPHTFPYLVDKFFYTGASVPLPSALPPAPGDSPGGTVGGPAGDGWFKMFEFFEVPSLAMGAIGPVSAGANFDWARQDARPGQLNPNLIIDEEVFFSLLGKTAGGNLQNELLLNFIQLPPLLAASLYHNANGSLMPLLGNTPILQFGPPVPLVVSAIDANGSPSYYYPIANQSGSGVTSADAILNLLNSAIVPPPMPPNSIYDSRIKAAFAQFLWLRHGGSGYIFGFGNGATGQNAAVVPYDPPNPLPAGLYGTGIPMERPFHSLSYPDIDFTIMRPAALPPSAYTNPAVVVPTPVTNNPNDPGVKNINLFAGYTSTAASFGGVPGNALLPAGSPVLPPAIPTRRLFQVPDSYLGNATTTPPIAASNASEAGDPYINNLAPAAPAVPPPTITNTPPYPATGALPPSLPTGGATTAVAYNGGSVPAGGGGGGYPNVFWSVWVGNGFVAPANPGSVTLGGTNAPPVGMATSSPGDNRQHPLFRIDQLQRAMSLTTPRTHQYAVWITIGFFEVKRQGDLGNLAQANPVLAFDVFGPENGSLTGKTVRYRAFFLVNRLNLSGFNPGSPGQFRAAVTYRQRIQ